MEEKIQDKYKESIEEEPIAVDKQPIKQSQEVPQIKAAEEPAIIKKTEPSIIAPVQPTDNSKDEGQVKVLREIAFEKGLDIAIEEAKKLNNPHILDEFHDDLVDKFYQKLVEAGKLEER